MSRIRARIVGLAALTALVVSSAAFTPSAPASDLTGKWLFTVVTENGTATPTVTFKQEGEKLTGKYMSQRLGDVEFTGTVKEKKFEFGFKRDMEGTMLQFVYTGTIESDSTVKGTADFGGMGSATFTGKRQ